MLLNTTNITNMYGIVEILLQYWNIVLEFVVVNLCIYIYLHNWYPLISVCAGVRNLHVRNNRELWPSGL